MQTLLATSTLLSKAILATKQTESSHALSLIDVLIDNALAGTVSWKNSVIASISQAIELLDQTISLQLNQIMHASTFKQLEGSWLGLHQFVTSSETGNAIHIQLFNSTKQEIFKDLSKAVEFDQSQLFKKIYEHEFGTPGGEPYSTLVADYEFTHTTQDIDLLKKLSNIAAASFCPLLTAAKPALLGFDSWTELSTPRDLETLLSSAEYAKWRSFRQSEDSRFVVLTLPRVLARLPYHRTADTNDEFNFEEVEIINGKPSVRLSHDNYCWKNAAYALATQITQAYAKYGWATAIRGFDGGGKVENLPLYTYRSDTGELTTQCPCEISITDRRETELSQLGLLPICHYKNTDFAVYFGAQTTHRANRHDKPEATANAMIASRLPYILATSRFAHYLKIMARDKIGSFIEAKDAESWLNRWILNYVNANAASNPELKAKYPLAEAKVEVKEIPSQPGCYHAIAWLRPWLQMEELTSSLRLVARIPKINR